MGLSRVKQSLIPMGGFEVDRIGGGLGVLKVKGGQYWSMEMASWSLGPRYIFLRPLEWFVEVPRSSDQSQYLRCCLELPLAAVATDRCFLHHTAASCL